MSVRPSRLRMMAIDDGVIRIGPQTVHLDITNGCNTNCVTCWDHSPHLHAPRAPAWKRQRADVAHLREVIDDIAALGGLEAVIVSGMGEPFTHPDVYALLSDLKRRDLHVTVITNLIAANVERILDIGVDALLVGVQGASEASYLAFHPNLLPSHWQTLQQQLERLADAPGIDVKHVQVICAANAHELVAMIEQAARLDATQVNFKLASLRHGTEAARIDDGQRARLLQHDIDAAQERATALGVAHNLAVFRAQVEAGGDRTAPIDQIGCFIGTTYSRITVEGTVLFCCNTEVVVGHLPPHPQGRPFSAWWTSPQWDHWRQRMRDGDYLSSCFQCGKLNQNEKLSRRFRDQFGEQRWRAVTGQDASKRPGQAAGMLRVLP